MTNFDFLLSSPDFAPFGEAAVAAEKIYAIDPAACVMTCRRAMENAVKWMYSVFLDKSKSKIKNRPNRGPNNGRIEG